MRLRAVAGVADLPNRRAGGDLPTDIDDEASLTQMGELDL